MNIFVCNNRTMHTCRVSLVNLLLYIIICSISRTIYKYSYFSVTALFVIGVYKNKTERGKFPN